MSKVDLNSLVNGLSGKLGNAVLRRRGSRTYMSQRPRINENQEPTEKMKLQRERFRRTAAYAKQILKDPVARAQYEQIASQKEFMNAFTVAVKDYLKSPVIDKLDASLYLGRIDDVVTVKVSDDNKVSSVTVTIYSSAGDVIENGAALFDPQQLEWKYTITQANANSVGSKVLARVKDRPGNESTMEVVIYRSSTFRHAE